MPIHATLRHCVHVIQRRCRFILLGIAVCTSATYAISAHLPLHYQATCVLKVNAAPITADDTLTHAHQLASNYALLVTSPAVLQAAAQKLPGLTVNQLQQTVSSSSIGTSQFISIQAQATTAGQAVLIANTVGNTFILVQKDREAAQLQATLDQLAPLITATRQHLDATQKLLKGQQQNAVAATDNSQQQGLHDTYQNSYNQLLAHYSQLQIQKLHVPTLLNIVQPAAMPDHPVELAPWLICMLAAGISGAWLVLWTLGVDWFDDSLKTADDVMRGCGLVTLGQVPLSLHLQKNTRLLDFSQVQLDAMRAAFMVVGANFQKQYKGQRSLLCTSLRPHSGTTLIASQLALTLVRRGMRVLLIDMNLRHPDLHTTFNRSNTQGLLTQLPDIQRISTQPAAWLAQWKTYVPNLWLLPCGPVEARSHLQVSIPALAQLQQCLQGPSTTEPTGPAEGLIDVIIFDAPPLEESLTQSLTTLVEANVLIVQSRTIQPEQLNRAGERLAQQQSPILGVVVNKRQAHHHTYFYHKPRFLTQVSTQSGKVGRLATAQPATITSPMVEKMQSTPRVDLPETPQPWQGTKVLNQARQFKRPHRQQYSDGGHQQLT